MHPKDTKACFLDHMGPYAMQASVLEHMVAGIQSGMIEAQERDEEDSSLEVRDGVAVIRLEGPVMKKRSKFGGASTIDARTQVRAALDDDAVHTILIEANSPGGPIAGVDELHREIKRANKIKPVHAHVTDLGASAVYWAICGASRITANRSAEVGSIGVFAVLEDSSEMAKREGVKVIPVSSGSLKGAGTAGTKISKEQIADMQSRVDKAADMFFAAVMEGRGIDAEGMKDIKRGSVFFADDALANGLIDEVADLEDVHAKLAAGGSDAARFGRGRMTRSGLAASVQENIENSVDGDTAIMAQSATLAGGISESNKMTELEKMKAELDKANKDKAELEAKLSASATHSAGRTATGADPAEAEIEKQVAAEVAKRTLKAAQKTAAATLVQNYGEDTGLTEKMAAAIFANCTSADQVDAELLLKEHALKGMAGGNAPVATQRTVKNHLEAASQFDTQLAALKEKHPSDLTAAVVKAKAANPEGYKAFMARANGGRDVVGLKAGRISA